MPRAEASRKGTKPILVKKESPNSRFGTVSNPSRAHATNVTTASLRLTSEVPVFTSTAVYSQPSTSEDSGYSVGVMESGLTVREYEGLVLDWLRQHLQERLSWLRSEGWMIWVEDVRLDVSEHERVMTILFRDGARPQCLLILFFFNLASSTVTPASSRHAMKTLCLSVTSGFEASRCSASAEK